MSLPAVSVIAVSVSAPTQAVVLQSLFFNKHNTMASLLRCGASEGVFAGMDGFVFVVERLYYGKQGFKQRKKKLRRKQAAQVLCRQTFLQLCILWLVGCPSVHCRPYPRMKRASTQT